MSFCGREGMRVYNWRTPRVLAVNEQNGSALSVSPVCIVYTDIHSAVRQSTQVVRVNKRADMSGGYVLKPEASVPHLDAAKWPLLLKNYDKMMVRILLLTWRNLSIQCTELYLGENGALHSNSQWLLASKQNA